MAILRYLNEMVAKNIERAIYTFHLSLQKQPATHTSLSGASLPQQSTHIQEVSSSLLARSLHSGINSASTHAIPFTRATQKVATVFCYNDVTICTVVGH